MLRLRTSRAFLRRSPAKGLAGLPYVADVKSGKQQAVGALLGQAKKRNQSANPNDVRRIGLELIGKM